MTLGLGGASRKKSLISNQQLLPASLGWRWTCYSEYFSSRNSFKKAFFTGGNVEVNSFFKLERLTMLLLEYQLCSPLKDAYKVAAIGAMFDTSGFQKPDPIYI